MTNLMRRKGRKCQRCKPKRGEEIPRTVFMGYAVRTRAYRKTRVAVWVCPECQYMVVI
ncbi:MAG: hypothetical protein JJE48_06740 [Actinobacteria bacterium]|nr:hypothetical protein [Actinomycetota bacterium]